MSQDSAFSTVSPPTPVPPLRAYGVLLMGILAVSLAAILIRLAQGEGVPSLVIAAARLTLASLILTPLALRRYLPQLRQLSRRELVLILLSAGFLALHFAAWVTSLEYTTVLLSVIIVTTTPVWVGLLEFFVLRARLSRGIVVGLATVIAGGLLIAFTTEDAAVAGGDALLGGGLSLIGALGAAAYLTIGRKLRATLPLIPYIWLVYSAAALILLLVLAGSGLSVVGYTTTGYLWLLALGLIPQLIGHSSLNYALAYLPATYVSIATQAEPIIGAVLAVVLFAELPSPLQIVGSGVILVGVTLATLSPTKAPDAAG